MKKIFLILTLSLPLNFTFAAEKLIEQRVKIQVTENGFEPAEIKVKTGSHVVLQVTRVTDSTCATSIHIKEKKISKELPLNQEVVVDLGTIKKGDTKFTCSMNMISGHIIAD